MGAKFRRQLAYSRRNSLPLAPLQSHGRQNRATIADRWHFLFHTNFAMQEASLQTMQATTDIQPRRGLPPMVSEFKAVLRHPITQAIPPMARRLSTPQIETQSTPSTGVSNASAGDDNQFITIGIHRTPEEFLKEAITIGHPTRLHSLFPDEIAETVQKCLATSPSAMALEDRRN